ncbi:hypothetical protein [Streptomyces sp. SID8352]|uniref:hypothetical protein n=1 Tax=Streptomyces sp. SID8352 TaxID=2690338 RepID=UPI001369CB14|nr:hypothetical protein [Streptomyces sp. SID8352]MYU24616.1 hypothetical protein [Streptomyces sp. SID8352]
MRKYLKAGDRVSVLEGPERGQCLTVSAVRMFATDSGYYLRGGSGLYPPAHVELASARADGNPCGSSCEDRTHDLIGTCDHCRGVCHCTLYREPATEK